MSFPKVVNGTVGFGYDALPVKPFNTPLARTTSSASVMALKPMTARIGLTFVFETLIGISFVLLEVWICGVRAHSTCASTERLRQIFLSQLDGYGRRLRAGTNRYFRLRAIALALRALGGVTGLRVAVRPAGAPLFSQRFTFFFGLDPECGVYLVHGGGLPMPDLPDRCIEVGRYLRKRVVFSVKEIERLEVPWVLHGGVYFGVQ